MASTTNVYGPLTDFGRTIHAMKYRWPEETFDDYCVRYARTTADTEKDFRRLIRYLRDQSLLPAGRQQLAVGRPNRLTAFNCFVSNTISDDTSAIFEAVRDGAITLRSGGGCGWDFSTIRPEGEPIRGLGAGAKASGPVSFMGVWDSMCRTIMSAGERRGAMMAVLRVDHPDVMKFVRAKQDSGSLTSFNISLAVTDEFMEAFLNDGLYRPTFQGVRYGDLRAVDVWGAIMESNWDYAEPGVLFIDRINRLNPLRYCETIAATNPSMPAGTMVHCDKGIVPIESLQDQTFKVKVFTGEWVEAKCFLSSESADLLEIDLGGGRLVRCTPEHRWPVLLNGRWVKVYARDLVPGDAIPLNLNESMGHKVRNDLSYDDGLAAGIIFGNGSYGIRKDDGRHYLSVSFNKCDSELVEFTKNYIRGNPSYQNDETVVNLTRSEDVRQLLVKLGIETDGNKKCLPKTVWASNDSFVAGFVDGLLSTDGYVGDSIGNRSIILTNKDPNVIREFGILIGFCGIPCTMHQGSTTLNGKVYPRSDLRINHNGVKRFAKVFKLSSVRKSNRLDTLCQIDTRDHINSTHAIVKGVRPAGREKVWDISVFHDTHVFPTEWCYTGNCAEQPLPPNGACLLGSVNVLKLLTPVHEQNGLELAASNGKQVVRYEIDWEMLDDIVDAAVRAFDNVIDRTTYPLDQQRAEALAKRRMGVGVTAMANALEVMGLPYATPDYLSMQDRVLEAIRNRAYKTSSELAREKGPFPLWDAGHYCEGEFFQRLPDDLKFDIAKHGLRNGLLTSIAPTGTISMAADNVSSGIEPVFALRQERPIYTPQGQQEFEIIDAAYNQFGVRGKTVAEVTAQEHIEVLCRAQRYVDSSISKTCNVNGQIGGEGPGMTYNEFKGLYLQAWEGGAKGCTTFNTNGKRGALLHAVEADDPGSACEYDPATGLRSCDV